MTSLPAPTKPKPVSFRAFDDTKALRNSVFDSVLSTAQNLQPVQNNRYTLSLSDVEYADAPEYNDEHVYQARLKQQSLTRKLRGTWNLYDTPSGKLLQSARKIVANVPYILDNGAVMDSGNSYYIRNQQRMREGIYVRQKENGEYIANVNTKIYEGPTHSYNFDPRSGKFNMEVSKNNIPLYTYMNAMGATDEELEQAWGHQILEANKNAARNVNMRKLYDRFVQKRLHQPGDRDDDGLMRQRIQEQAAAIKMSPIVNKATLGIDDDRYGKEHAIAATKKLIQLARGEIDSDSRDDMAFQSFHGPEDLFAERLQLDDGKIRRQLLSKLTFLSKNNPDLSKVPSGLLTKQLNAVITQSGLASPSEEINPFEQYSKLFSVTRMGQGAIGDDMAVPESAREVNNTQYGFIDPLQTPESLRVGVDLFIAGNARKGSDNNLYVPVINARTGQKEFKNAADLREARTTLMSEWAGPEERISGFDNDRQPRMGLRRQDIDYIFPEAQGTFNNLSNLVPMIGSVKGQRVAMASRMLTQALPIEKGEAPLVQSKMPGRDESYERHVGRNATVRSDVAGTVRKVTDKEIILDTPEGQKRFATIKNAPNNRKTILSYDSIVQPGQEIKPGDMLAKSNYTDETGAIAQGLNARAVIMPWRGNNTMDGITISQSFANRMRSQHAYQNRVDWSDNIKRGKTMFMGAFPGAYDKAQLETIDDDGIVKIGTRVKQGDPLVLKADVNTKPVDRIHRKGAQSLMNSALEWDDEDDGVVTDVFNDKSGVNVIVSSNKPMRTADKLCFFEETEVLTELGWKSVKDITFRDKVACLEGDDLVYRNPTALYQYPSGGRTYHISNANIDIEVTDNHQLYVKLRGKDTFELTPARELYGKQCKYRKWANWKGKDPEEVVLPELEYVQGNRWGGLTKKKLPPKVLTVKQYLFLLAGFITEGNLVNGEKDKKGNYGIDICQVKEPNRSEMHAELKRLGIKYCNCSNGEKVRVYSKQLYEHFKQFGERAKYKFLPSEIFNWSKESLEYLFKWMMWGDGSYQNNLPRFFHTSSTQLADDFSKLCLHIGKSANVSGNWKHTEFIEKGKSYDIYMYQVNIVNVKLEPEVNHSHVKEQKAQKEYFIENRAEPVYCIEVPQHIIYVRRNGKTVFIGQSNRYGAKGVINEVVPDELMPITPDGPAEVVYSPIGNIGRVNYGMIHEHLLGRIAKKLGKPINMESFDPNNPDTVTQVLRMAKEHGIDPRASITDPETGQQIKGIDGKGLGYGYSYVQKLHHTAEGKADERSFGRYTSEGAPASGGEGGAKRVALMHTNALISHGAYNILADARRIRGQKNDDYWAAFMRGYQPPEPEQPELFHKFLAHMEGAGIRVLPKANKFQILALTNNDVNELAGNREVMNSQTIKWEGDKKGIKGGLLDPAIFGEYGDRWGFIKPTQPVLNPVMEEPARRMLGLTQAKLEDVIAGREALGVHGTGPKAIKKALASLNVDNELYKAREIIANGRGTVRDNAIKKVQFLQAAKDNGISPGDWMLDKIPVIPPKFRPVSEMTGSKTALVADVNYLYKQYIDHNEAVKELERGIGDAGEEYLQSYNYFKQITGMTDPTHPKLVQKRVSGLLRSTFGESSSKWGLVQRSLLGGGVDNIGRNVITTSSNLDMDEVGLPINSAYEVYKPFIMRKLTQSGIPLMTAKEMFDNKDRRAKQALLQLTKERPVIIDRSPVLHKYGIMAFWPKLIRGNHIQMNQYVQGGFGADNDGDAVNFQVVASKAAVEEAKQLLLPSQNLLNTMDSSPNFTPQEDYIAGLYEATRKRKKPGRPKVFATMEDMKRAFARGEISVSDEVEILKR